MTSRLTMLACLRTGLLALFVGTLLSGCGSWTLPTNANTSLPAKGSIVPNTTLQVLPSLGIPLEKFVYWGAYVGLAYLIIDPLAPNWSIEEAPLPDDHIHLALKMKRFHNGGDGETRVVFQRRARDLMQYGGFDSYQVVEYNEGIESSVLGSQRVGEGVIHLIHKTKAVTAQGSAPPARSIPDKTSNPRS